mgnify:CR=1 FL=1
MLYHLFSYLREWNFIGSRLFMYVSFRVVLTFILALLITTILGHQIIKRLQRLQIGEEIRNLGLEGQMQKKGTPTMGGIIIILAILIPTLLFARLDNVYVILMIITTILMGLLGFLDDYIKVFRKNKEGLAGRYKIVGQVLLGLIVGITLYMSPATVIKENSEVIHQDGAKRVVFTKLETKSTQTTVPFFKNNNLDYSEIIPLDGPAKDIVGWTIFIAMTVFVVTMLSNSVNLTDGIDGLASGSSAIVGVVLGILAYVSSHFEMAGYLNIMYIVGAEELVVFAAAFVGATIGFLWYNSYPAQVFMGDVGSLALGGALGVVAILVRQEFLLVIMGGVFVVEALSVILQVGSYKLRKQRIFRMAPIHHHFELKGWPEPRVIIRFWIISLMLVLMGLVTLKLR